MAIIKSYTDLEQSKKLAEILPLESADGWWTALNWQETEYYIEVKQDGINKPKKYVPCWSLAALLAVLPNENMLVKTTDGKYYCLAKDIMTKHYNNPIDACVEMIIKLSELKIL